MFFFSNFTWGGRLQSTGIRGFLQVFNRLLKISLCIFILLTGSIYYYKTSPYERYLLKQWGVATIFSGPGVPSKTMEFRTPSNRKYKISPKLLISIPIIKNQPKITFNLFLKATKLSSLATTLLSLFIAFFITWYGSLRNQQKSLRGASFASSLEFKQTVKSQRMASKWSLGGVPLPKEAETQHILLCGSPGGGKSVCTNELLTQVRKANQKALVYDIKGAFIPHYYRPGKDIILNPLDDRTPSWNLWQEAKEPVDFDSSAAAIVQDTSREDTFWIKAARTLLSISALQFSHRSDPRMKDLIQHLFCGDLKNVESLLEGTIGQAMVGKDLEKGTRSVILTLVTYCKSLMYLRDEPCTPAFIIRDWVANEADDSWLFISSSQRMAETLKPIISLWIELAVNALLSLKEDRNRRLWFFFDELASLQRLPSLEPVLSRGRGYGACFVGAIQDIHQLKDLYGDKAAEVLVSLFGTGVFFSTNNHYSAKWAAEQLGRTEFLEAKEGYSMGSNLVRDGVTLNHQRHQELLVMDSEIRHLKKREAFMVTAGGWPVTKLSFKVKNYSERHPAFIGRDLSEIDHQTTMLENNIQNLKFDITESIQAKKHKPMLDIDEVIGLF
jgi:type IV conjugative transfer system coupling protein TraD